MKTSYLKSIILRTRKQAQDQAMHNTNKKVRKISAMKLISKCRKMNSFNDEILNKF